MTSDNSKQSETNKTEANKKLGRGQHTEPEEKNIADDMENPQEGKKWSNYRTRELANGDEAMDSLNSNDAEK